MSQSADHGPIQEDLRDQMNALARGLDDLFNGKDCPADQKRVGFFLTAFPFNEPGRFNYISNADKLDVRAMLKDVLARIEGRMSEAGRA
jgi:cobalamin biosynthesis Mg chelatase CobN